MVDSRRRDSLPDSSGRGSLAPNGRCLCASAPGTLVGEMGPRRILIGLGDWVDDSLLRHRLHGVCHRIATSSWWAPGPPEEGRPRYCPGCGHPFQPVGGSIVPLEPRWGQAAFDCWCKHCGWSGDISPDLPYPVGEETPGDAAVEAWSS